MEIETAIPDDSVALSETAKKSFLEDKNYQPPAVRVSGPPGHDNADAHQKWIEDKLYLKCTIGARIVGGIVVDTKNNIGEIETLFVDPLEMNKGIGRELVLHVLNLQIGVTSWILQTPDYALRNQKFYESLGFKCTHKTPYNPQIGFGFYHYAINNV